MSKLKGCFKNISTTLNDKDTKTKLQSRSQEPKDWKSIINEEKDSRGLWEPNASGIYLLLTYMSFAV